MSTLNNGSKSTQDFVKQCHDLYKPSHHRMLSTLLTHVRSKLRMLLLPACTLAAVARFTSFATCLVVASRTPSPAELWQLNVSWLLADFTRLSCLLTPGVGFSLHPSLLDVWNDLVSEIWFFAQSSSLFTVEQLVLRKSNVAALAARSRFRLLRFLRLFVCKEISSSTAVCIVAATRQSLPTTFHFSSAFCSDFCRVPFPTLGGSLLVFFTEVWLCCIVLVFTTKKTNH